MKRKFILLISSCLLAMTLSACDADAVNETINDAAVKAGLSTQVDIKQEDLDKIEKAGKDVVDTVKDVATDEDVHKAVNSAIDTIKDAVRESESENE